MLCLITVPRLGLHLPAAASEQRSSDLGTGGGHSGSCKMGQMQL